jgi:uncharacterized membrane protein
MGDLSRSAIAFGVCVFFALLTPTLSYSFLGLFCVALLFGFYLAESVSRLRSSIDVDDVCIQVSGGLFGRRIIKWSALEKFELRHFAVGRTSKSSWMDLKLTGGGRSILIDDKLEGFNVVLSRAWRAAQAASVGVSDTTLANLTACGLTTGGEN